MFGGNAAQFNPARYLDESRQVKVLGGREEGFMLFGLGGAYALRYVAEGTLAIDLAMLV